MSRAHVDRPIFVVGVPRSGTTVVFNTFAARPDIAWFTQHLNYLPRWPSVTVLARVTDHFPRARKSILRSDDPTALAGEGAHRPGRGVPDLGALCG